MKLKPKLGHSFLCNTYRLLQNVEKYLREKVQKFQPCAKTPLGSNCWPEIDFTPELQPESAAYYQSIIRMLRWMVEIGRVNICCQVSMISSSLTLPRSGHVKKLYHIFSYLKKHHTMEIISDTTEPTIDEELV